MWGLNFLPLREDSLETFSFFKSGMGKSLVSCGSNFLEAIEVKLPDEAGHFVVPEVDGENFLFEKFFISNFNGCISLGPTYYVLVFGFLSLIKCTSIICLIFLMKGVYISKILLNYYQRAFEHQIRI